MRKDDDLYLDEYEPAGLRWMSFAVVLLAVSGFFALAWYAYNTGQNDMRVEDVMIVEAKEAPYKIAPTHRGGAEFKHKDKAVYNALTPQASRVEKTQTLPKPEAPKRPALKVAEQTPQNAPAAPVAKKAKEVTSYVSPIPKPVEPEALKNPNPYAPIKEQPKLAPKSAPKPTPIAVDPIVAAVKKAASKVQKGETVQLGAFRSQAEADGYWAKTRRSHLDLLDRNSHRVVKADLGAKGVYYRLRITGLPNKAAADTLCKKLSARAQPCFYSGKM